MAINTSAMFSERHRIASGESLGAVAENPNGYGEVVINTASLQLKPVISAASVAEAAMRVAFTTNKRSWIIRYILSPVKLWI